jgi:hypothetical protein
METTKNPAGSDATPVGIKGVALRATIDYVRKQEGDAAATRLLADLAEPAKAGLSHGILAATFYPLPWLVALQDGAAKGLGGDRREVLRQIGRFAAEDALTGVYRIFMKVGSPEFIFGRSTRMFGNYFQGVPGEALRCPELRKGYSRIEIDRYPGGHADFCRRLDGYFERLLELSGAKSVRVVHSRCAWRGEPLCEWKAHWES